MSSYPAAMTFDLSPDKPYRAKVLAAARRLGLKVIMRDGDRFDVVVISPMAAYEFGAACSDDAVLAGMQMPPTRRIDLED